MNIEIEKVLLRQNDFLQEHGIDVWTKKEVSFFYFPRIVSGITYIVSHTLTIICSSKVKSVDAEAKILTFNDGTSQHYDQLLISTGGRLDHSLFLHRHMELLSGCRIQWLIMYLCFQGKTSAVPWC